jgi:hypothetical protein
MKTESASVWRGLLARARHTFKAHPLACLGLGLTLVLATVTLAVRAQQSAATTDQLAVALALYEQGAFRDAQPLFAAVPATDPAHDVAQTYDALCRYELCRADAAGD